MSDYKRSFDVFVAMQGTEEVDRMRRVHNPAHLVGALPAPQQKRFDAVVVLGGGLDVCLGRKDGHDHAYRPVCRVRAIRTPL